MSERDEWETSRLQAYIWSCNDDHCDCHQPMIDRITPNRKAGFPWINRDAVWQGTFETGGEGLAEMEAELQAAAEVRGIPLNENFYGCIPESHAATYDEVKE